MDHANNAHAATNTGHNINNHADADDDDRSSTTTHSSGGAGRRSRKCRHALMAAAEIAILLLCLPCLLASTMIDRRRRHCQEHPRRYSHTVLVAAPTRRMHVVINEFSPSWPPAAEAPEMAAARAAASKRALATAGGDDAHSRRRRLLIPANRVFCLKRDASALLASGNVATSAPGFEIAGTPRLVATVPTRRWRDMLRLFKAERDALVAPPATRKPAAAAAAAAVKTAHTMLRACSLSRSTSRQKAWVRRCCHVLRRDFDVSSPDAAAAATYHYAPTATTADDDDDDATSTTAVADDDATATAPTAVHRDGGQTGCPYQPPEEETFQIWEVRCWAHEKVAIEEIVFDTDVARVHLVSALRCPAELPVLASNGVWSVLAEPVLA